MTPWTKLPFFFEPHLMRGELEKIPDSAWVPHFNQNDYSGRWSSVSLRSRSGRSDDIQPRGQVEEFTDTPLARACPYLKEVVDTFEFPKKSVRLLRLHAHSQVHEHRDPDLGLENGEVRIHVPIVTNDRLEFVVANRQLVLREGECWFIDFSQPHRIHNAGDTDRTHLVIDGTANEWALALIQRAAQELPCETLEPAGMRSLRQFRASVFDDPALQAELLQITGLRPFLAAVVAAGLKRGYSFQTADVESAYQQSRREWLASGL